MPTTVKNVAPRARALRKLRTWIAEGTLEKGLALPPDRELSARLGVGLGTVQRALRILIDEGVVRHDKGRTRVLVGSDQSANSNALDGMVVVAGFEQPFPHATGGWLDFISVGAVEATRAAGLHSLLLSPAALLSDEELRRVEIGRPKGVVFPEQLGGVSIDVIARLAAAGLPVVVNGDGPPLTEYDRVVSDHEAGAYALTRWLIQERGCKRILQLAFAHGDYWMAARRVGYERAMREAGIEPLAPLEFVGVKPASTTDDSEIWFKTGAAYLTGLLYPWLTGSSRVDAVLAISDEYVPWVARAARTFGLQPGQDLLIAGYDNLWAEQAWQDFELAPPTVTIDRRNQIVGQELVNLLLDRAAGRIGPEPLRRIIAPELVVPTGAERANIIRFGRPLA
jgi:DNA-binding LacI/PurR family transcriptional regulator